MLDDTVSALGVSFLCCADGRTPELQFCITTVVSAVFAVFIAIWFATRMLSEDAENIGQSKGRWADMSRRKTPSARYHSKQSAVCFHGL
jgi:hypothetical protein